MPGTAGNVGVHLELIQAGNEINAAAAAHLLEAFHAMQPQFQEALLNIAEVYAERYPAPNGLYIV